MDMIIVGSKLVTDYKLVYALITKYLKEGVKGNKVITFDLPGTCSLAKLVAEEIGAELKVIEVDEDHFVDSIEDIYSELVRGYYSNPSVTFALITGKDKDEIRLDSLAGLLRESPIHYRVYKVEPAELNILECSTAGDRRYSAFGALVTIGSTRDIIENIYQNAKINRDGEIAGKGRSFSYMKCPITGKTYDTNQVSVLYKVLWLLYFKQNPHLLSYARGFDGYTDRFRGRSTVNCQADVIHDICKDFDKINKQVNESTWYKDISHLL